MGMEMGMGTSMKRETASARTDEIRLPRSSGAKERSHLEQLRPPIANISISIAFPFAANRIPRENAAGTSFSIPWK